MGSQLTIVVAEVDASTEAIEQAGSLLRDELLTLDVGSVTRLPAGAAPAGARAADAGVVGGLLVVLPPTIPLLTALVGVVGQWLGRSAGRSVHLQIDGDVLELGRVSAKEQHELVQAWLSRRGGDGGRP